MEEDVCDVISGLLVSAEHVLNEVNTLIANNRPFWSFKEQSCVQDAFFNLLNRRTLEWHLSTEELVENAAEAPDIALVVVWLLKNNLRCLIPKCTSFLYDTLVLLKVACQTKVSDFDLRVLASAA